MAARFSNRKEILVDWPRKLTALPRYAKRALIVTVDLVAFSFVLWGMLSLRYGDFYWPPDLSTLLLVLLGPALTAATFGWFGLYRLVTRFIGYNGTLQMATYALLASLVWALLVFLSGQLGIPRAVVLAYGPATALTAIGIRQIAGFIFRRAGMLNILPIDNSPNVVVYGAGLVGAKLIEDLVGSGLWNVVSVIDPLPSMRGQFIHGIRISLPSRLPEIVARSKVEQVFIAFQGHQRAERRAALRLLAQLPVKVRIVPDALDIASGRVTLNALRPVQASDLLGRERVAPHQELLARAIRGKSVLVTGAGGSIGSELARQVLRNLPSRLVLFDSSEPALYEIDAGLRAEAAEEGSELASITIMAVLGSVREQSIVEDVLARYEIDVIFHAAAYKHVPMVEYNPLVALANNVLGTACIAQAALQAGVSRFVLVSTDKAVRPTNVMGASKRMAELLLQALAAEQQAPGSVQTIFTAVRFGNVLDSSGSVVRRFRQQISSGGPVTVTDANVTRFFMSIEEAAELVIQASAMAKGGEVFLLDMGEPVRIDDLARLMIRRSGLEVRSPATPHGDIEIAYIGLRPGEKLYEELLIGENSERTEHPRIRRSNEPTLPLAKIEAELVELAAAVADSDTSRALSILRRNVEGYTPDEMTLMRAESQSPCRVRKAVAE